MLQSIHDVINGVHFLFVNVNEVTKIDNASWISWHLYVVQGWNQIILLVCVKKVDVQRTTTNVFQLMLQSLDSFAGVSAKDLGQSSSPWAMMALVFSKVLKLVGPLT